MKYSTPNEAIIRDYLLGRLEMESELVERIDQQLLNDAEFAERVDIVEDEIIEEYIEGTLSATEKLAVEKHFLHPPERQQKLRIARSLGRHLATDTVPIKEGQATVRYTDGPVLQRRPQVIMYGGLAAAVLLVVSSVFLVRQRTEFQSELRESNQKLVNEREHSVLLSGQLEAARELAQPATVTLSLVQPGIFRGGEHLLLSSSRSDEYPPQLRIGGRTQSVHAEIALTSSVAGPYDIQLESAGKVVWSKSGVEAFTSSAGSVLMFDVPVQALTQGEAKFLVSRRNESGTSYYFEISKQ
jgi:hypothetical protein